MIKSPLQLLSAWSTWFRYPTLRSSRLRTVVLFYPYFMSIGLLLSSQWEFSSIIALKCYVVMASITIFVYTLNDVMDADLDKLSPNKSKRPIPSGLMTKRQGILLGIVFGVLGVALSLTINLLATILVFVFMGLGFFYSVPPIRLKRRFLMKETTLTTLFIISILIGSAAVGRIPSSLFLPVFFFVLSTMTVQPAFYDVQDVNEDRLGGCKTIAMILNQRRRLELATSGLLGSMITITLSYGYFGFNVICPILTVFGCLLFLRYIFPLMMKTGEEYEEEVIEKIARIGMIVAFIIPLGFMLGSL